MAAEIHNYEKVSIYPLDADVLEKLLSINRECVFNWCTQDNHPMGVVMSYIWMDGRVWLTAGAHRHRISAVRRNPKVSVVITSAGTEFGPGKTVTIKGRCVIHEDRRPRTSFTRRSHDTLTRSRKSGQGSSRNSLIRRCALCLR